ncbi:hypothetical protein M0R45_001893 [Rubus argutus]|uniref:S-adenosylmethionine-dependent methyltransferase n=1 Tax=Rubus argutus TaxID=59490 RepID=A0AAW1VI43_RUBAR
MIWTISTFAEREAMESVKELVTKGIAEKLDIDLLLPSNVFHIVDLGCSVGPNTFSSVENILEAVLLKYQSQGPMDPQIPEFQVFFNDHTPNDFNLLFKSLPPNRQYYAVGVPESPATTKIPTSPRTSPMLGLKSKFEVEVALETTSHLAVNHGVDFGS